jgi:hypothetical protein
MAMWAGTMWSNMTRQSVKGVLNTTVTVFPPLLPVTEATSRYPSVEATWSGCPSTSTPSPRWDCQA